MAYSQIGKYEVVEEIGHGGMGYVYRAFDPVIERTVAIKVVSEHILDQAEMKERFYREAKSAGRLSHPNITIVHDVGEIEGRPYIVMEYLDGLDLKALIKEERPKEIERKIDYAIQICRALSYAHENKLVHRDIKPENVKVLENGRVKIMDFGIAKPESSDLTEQGTMLGTPSYMSPEQIRGAEVDRRSDIFSFGVLFQELLTYKKPFGGSSTTTVIYKIVHEDPDPVELIETHGELSADLQQIITRCLRKNPDERYSTCDELIHDFEEFAIKWNLEIASEVTNPSIRRRTGSFSQTISTAQLDLGVEVERTIAAKRKLGWVVWAVAGLLTLTVLSVAYFKINQTQSPAAEPVAETTEIVESSVKLESVLKAKSAMLDMKAEATISGAKDSSADAFQAASEEEQAAELALDQGDYERSLETFETASASYRDARDAANQAHDEEFLADQAAALTRTEADPAANLRVQVNAAQRQMDRNRASAKNSSASTRVPDVWNRAELTAKLAQDFARSDDVASLEDAKKSFEEAAKFYRAAAQQALIIESGEKSAQAAKQRITVARQKLESLGPLTMEQRRDGEQLEKDGDAHLANGDFSSAEQAYRASATSFDGLFNRATKAQQDQANAAQKSADESRQKALAAGVAELAAADKIRQTGIEALSQGNFVSAQKSFETAAVQYRALTDQAQSAVKASGPTADELITKLSEKYSKALAAEDIELMNQLISLSKDEKSGWQQFFDFASAIESQIEQQSLNVNGDKAELSFLVKLSYDNTSTGKRDQRNINNKWSLAQRNGAWVVESRQ